MGTKTVNFSKKGLDKLPNDKPALYRIKTDSGTLNYVGIAKQGRISDRLSEHLGEIPGSKVQIEQFSSVNAAKEKEARVIARIGPKYNKKQRAVVSFFSPVSFSKAKGRNAVKKMTAKK